MSLNKRAYSPLASTYSYSSTLSPSYNYSRVSSYIDALQKDQTITKLRKQLSDVRSLQMKYNSMMQQIHLAEKQNQLLQIKNQDIQKEYLQKIKTVKGEIQLIKSNFSQLSENVESQEQATKQVEGQIQRLIEELKNIKAEQETTELESSQLQKQIEIYKNQAQCLKEQSQTLKEQKNKFKVMVKQLSQKMQNGSQKMAILNQCVSKQQQEVQLLIKQLQNSTFEAKSLSTITQKNLVFIENHLRKITIQDGQIQQLKIQLGELKQQLQNIQQYEQQKKEQLFKSIMTVQQKSSSTLQNLADIQKILTLDNTSKQYVLDLKAKLQKLAQSNQKLHQMQKHLQGQLHKCQMNEYKLAKQAKCNIQNDFMVKKMLQNRLQSIQ